MWDSDLQIPDHQHAYFTHWSDSDAHSHGGPAEHDFAPIQHSVGHYTNEEMFGLATNKLKQGAKLDVEKAQTSIDEAKTKFKGKFYGIAPRGFDNKFFGVPPKGFEEDSNKFYGIQSEEFEENESNLYSQSSPSTHIGGAYRPHISRSDFLQ